MFDKEALVYLMEEMAPVTEHEIGGETFSDRPLHRVDALRRAEPIRLSTLSSFVDFIKAGYDIEMRLYAHVVSPTEVQLYSELDSERGREHLVKCVANVPGFTFDRFMPHDSFCIAMQSKFMDSPDRALLLKFAGTVEAGSIAEYGDDGVTQKATVKTGIASKGDAIVPNPVSLIAYRTFIEVEQPAAQYIFRMQQGSGGVQCALFEADGGAWAIAAMQRIRHYLETALSDVDGLVVIS